MRKQNMENRKFLIYKYTFHPVGQGLFYSGYFKSGNNTFNLIYDCGGKKELVERAIKNEYKYTSKIDLLILSHLHADHYNGLPYLLEKVKVSVNTVVLPYLTPIERLMIALSDLRISNELLEFLADPVEYLLDKYNVKKVILMVGKEPDEDDEWLRNTNTNDTFGEGMYLDIEKLGDGDEIEENILRNEPKLKDYIENHKVVVKNHKGHVEVKAPNISIWFFRFFNRKPPQNNLSNFKKCVKRIIGSIESQQIKKAIKGKNNLENLKSCYKSITGDINETSLLMLHGPICNFKNIKYSNSVSYERPVYFVNLDDYYPLEKEIFIWENVPLYSNNIIILNKRHVQSCTEAFHMLTGDVNLNNCIEDIKRHFCLGTNIKALLVFQIPHHGSRSSWNSAICKHIKSHLWVVSAGISNKYKHPSQHVIKDILSKCNEGCLIWVNEGSKCRVEGYIENVLIPETIKNRIDDNIIQEEKGKCKH